MAYLGRRFPLAREDIIQKLSPKTLAYPSKRQYLAQQLEHKKTVLLNGLIISCQ